MKSPRFQDEVKERDMVYSVEGFFWQNYQNLKGFSRLIFFKEFIFTEKIEASANTSILWVDIYLANNFQF